MRRLLLALCLLLPLPLAAAPAYVEGRHYLELALPQPTETGSKIEVREFFWYGCPHCFSLEPSLEKWLKTMPKNAQFVRTPGVAPRWLAHARAYYAFELLGASSKTHVAFFRAMHERNRPLDSEDALVQFAVENGVDKTKFREAFNSFGVRVKLDIAPRWLAHARAYYAFELLGASSKTHVAFFRALHERNRPLDSEDALAQFAVENGVDKAKFREAFNSFGVRVKLDKARQMNMEMGINSVPTLAVDGRYITSPTMAGGDLQMLKVVEFLIQKVARERKARAKKP